MPRAAVFAAMRNEGPFLLEWVAYHRILGFDRVIIASNDCTDGSDILLDLLHDHGVITHLRHSPAPDAKPQDSAMQACLTHLHDHPVDWLLHIDADEYLNLTSTLDALLDLGQQADVIALRWRLFGDNGHATWPGATMPHFTACEAGPHANWTKFKSFFRPAHFDHAEDHMPKSPRIPHPQVISAAGQTLDATSLASPKHHARYRPLDLSLQEGLGLINHYALRSPDTFELRRSRGDGQGKDGSKYRLNSRWHQMANRNEVQDTSILRHWPATHAELTRLRALPAIAATETACLDALLPNRKRA